MLLDDIRAYLIANGLAPADNNTAPSGTFLLYEGYMPDDTDVTMGLFETSSGKPALTLLREVVEVTFQLRVRGTRLNYAATRSQWQACFNALQDSQPTSDYALVQTYNYGPLTFNDDRGRPNFVSNFRAIMLNDAPGIYVPVPPSGGGPTPTPQRILRAIPDGFTNQTSVTFVHGLNSVNVDVVVYTDANNRITPQSVHIDDANTVTVTFGVPVTGYMVVIG